jgi:type II secretory pathway pseudopilin PulG
MSPAFPRGQRGAALLMMLMVFGLLGAFFAMRKFNSPVVQVEKEQASLALMNMAKEALLGFAAANGRLPCPATAASNGVEAPIGGPCTNPYIGYLPASTLGLPGMDSTGYLRDPWAGRLRYAVTTANGNAATTTDGIKVVTVGSFVPDLRVCSSSTNITATTCGTAQPLTTTAVAVIFSSGPNGSTATGQDEAENDVASDNQVFISHPRTDDMAANGEFDDLVTWVPSDLLFARMRQNFKLPTP